MKTMKKIISLLLLSLLVVVPFSVTADDGYEEVNIAQGIAPKVTGKGSINSPQNLTDGKDNTVSDFWGFQYFELDFGSVKNITSVAQVMRPEKESVYTLKLYLKGETGDYALTDTKEIDNSQGVRHDETVTFTFAPTNARYAKVEITTNKGNVVLYEFKAFTKVHKMLGETGSTNPLSGEKGVSNAGSNRIDNVLVTFGQEMDVSTLTASNITVASKNGTVAFTEEDITKTANSLSFPINKLESGTEYTVTLSENIAFSDTTPVGFPYSFTFETGTIVKAYVTAESFIASHYPEDKDENVVNTEKEFLELLFNEEMEPTTLVPENVEIVGAKTGKLAYDKFEATATSFQVSLGLLEDNETYTVTVKNLASLSGKMAETAYTFTFSTGDIMQNIWLDTLIAKTYPTDGLDTATNVDTEGYVTVAFSENVTAASVKTGIVLKEKASGKTVTAPYIYENNTYKLDMYNLKSNTEYVLTIKANALKVTGANILGDDVTVSFKTGTILNMPQIPGKRIKNVLLNKPVIHTDCATGTGFTDKTTMNDGDLSTEYIMHGRDGQKDASTGAIRNERYVIDMGNTYHIFALKFTPNKKRGYGPGTNKNYQITGIKISAGLLNRTRNDAELLHTTAVINDGDPTYLENLDVYARYITLAATQADGVLAEMEAFAYVDVNYDISVENKNGSLTFTVNGYNYTEDNEKTQLLISQYDENGVLLSTRWHDFTNTAGGATENFTVTKTGKTVKAVLIDRYDGFKMLTNPIVVE